MLPRRIEDDYIVEEKELGTGHNGSVYLAKSMASGEKCAVKPFKLFRITKAQMRELRNEVEVTLAMDHPHVARLRDVYECEQYLKMVTECLEGGELFDRIMKFKRFNESDARETTHQILLAINYLHSKGICHRDIKLENFLYDTKECKHLKLIDFGFSRYTRNKTMKLACGTLAYTAPEVLGGQYTTQCDIWSAGVVVFILLMGYMPFAGSDEEVQAAILAGNYTKKQKQWESLSASGRSFIETLLQVDPEQRPSAEQALQLPWMVEKEPGGEPGVDSAILESLRGFAKASRFRRAAMSMMAWTLTNEERSQVRDSFVALDTDNTGTITLMELKTVLLQKVGVTDEEVQRIFDAMDDHNKHEAVNYSDFLAAMMTSRIAMNEDRLHETFKRFDLDNTGYISPGNVREVLGGCLSKEETDRIMAEVDVSRDGKISWEEFSAYMHSGVKSQEHLDAVAKVIDNEIRASISRHTTVKQAASEAPPPVKQEETKSEITKSEFESSRSATPSSTAKKRGSKLCTVM